MIEIGEYNVVAHALLQMNLRGENNTIVGDLDIGQNGMAGALNMKFREGANGVVAGGCE